MRITHVITRADVGGAQTYVLELAKAQAHRGNHLTIVAGHLGVMAEHARQAGIEVVEAPSLRRDASGRHDLVALRQIGAVLAGTAPDLIHAHSSKAGALARLVARRRRLPIVYTAHGWPFQAGAPRLQRLVSRFGETFCGHWWGHVICVSEAEAALARARRVVPARRLHVVPNAVADSPHRRAPGAATGRDVRVVMVARFAPPKDQLGVVRALALLPATGWRMTFVGDGVGLAGVRDAAAAAGLCDRVEFLGESDDVPVLLAGADVAVLWSAYEGMPLALMEAMRAGLACVANELPGTRELLGDDAGILLPREPADLACALAGLFDDRLRLEALATAARARYEHRFALDAHADAVDAVYGAARRHP